MLIDATLDDVKLTRAFTGLPTSMLIRSVQAAGIDPKALNENTTPAEAARTVRRRGPRPAPLVRDLQRRAFRLRGTRNQRRRATHRARRRRICPARAGRGPNLRAQDQAVKE